MSTATVDRTREEKIEVATTYLDGLRSRKGDGIRLAPDVSRKGNGVITTRGEEAIRAGMVHEPVAAITGLRWIVDGDNAVAFYDLDTTFEVPVYLAERFLIRDGLIHEIEFVFSTDQSKGPRPERPRRDADRGAPGPCTLGNDPCVQWTALQYLGALLSHDGSRVPLAPDAWRIENGHDTGQGDGIRDALANDVMNVIGRLDGMRWFIEGDQAAVFYELHATIGLPDGMAPPPPMPIAERFRVQNGLIKEIEAIFSLP